MSLIKCENLSFAYNGIKVASDISFSVDEGDYLCIVGENGAGKSTLVKGLLNLKKPSSGKILYGKGLKSDEIGYLPQISLVQQDFPASVYEIVLSGCLNKLGYKPFYTSRERNLAKKNMEKIGILDIKNSSFRELSGGQQRRALLARALCASSRLILLDEPTAGLDPIVTREFYEIVDSVNKEMGISVIMVSHDIKSSVSYANKMLHIHQGVLFFGTTQEYIKSTVGKRFLGE